ncbi:MAG TPA: zinc ribbon domain-containing protein [Candidatus Dorea intestinavium]|nr:zinc ribbon domain-containing protein [Candidatus Dorea intestinavium]
MALVTCPTCNEEISNRTDNCPNCGALIEKDLESGNFEDLAYRNGITKECLGCSQYVAENSVNCPHCGFAFDKRYELLIETRKGLTPSNVRGFFGVLLVGLFLIILDPLLVNYANIESGFIFAGVFVTLMGLLGFIAAKDTRKKNQETYYLLLNDYERYLERERQKEQNQ